MRSVVLRNTWYMNLYLHGIASFGMSLSGNPCASKYSRTLSHFRPAAFVVVATASITVAIHSIMALVIFGSLSRTKQASEKRKTAVRKHTRRFSTLFTTYFCCRWRDGRDDTHVRTFAFARVSYLRESYLSVLFNEPAFHKSAELKSENDRRRY